MNDSSNSTNGSVPAKHRDYGNLLCTVLFLSLTATSFLQHAWSFALAWLSLGLSFAIMHGASGLAGENWKKPRSLVAIALVLIGTGVIIAKVILTATGRIS